MSRVRAAVIQMKSGENSSENLAQISASIREAKASGAQLICFPENAVYRGRRKNCPIPFAIREGRLIERDPLSAELSKILKESEMVVSIGSILEESSDPNRPYNSHIVWLPQERKIFSYRKIHLFEFDSGSLQYRESENISAGKEIESVRIDAYFTAGLSICYDLRFPELYRKLSLEKAANLLLVPSAFTLETGKAHWHSLLKARAIENLSYVIASAQWGEHLTNLEQTAFCYGHSLILSPWGETLYEAPEASDARGLVDLEIDLLKKCRTQLPVLKHRRLL